MMKNKKFLSFIVPVYNVEEYLKECLDSLVCQDVPLDEYEIICINDGSIDKSGEILDLYAQQFNNIIVVHKENGGVSSARNCGIDIAKGNYIWFVDSDDFIKHNCLLLLKPLITENQYDAIRVLPYYFKDGKSAFRLETVSPEKSQKSIEDFFVTYIFKNDNITKNKIYFDTGISYTEDAVFMIQIHPFLNNVYQLKDSILYFYRGRAGSAVSQKISRRIGSRINAALACDEIIKGKRIGDVKAATKFKYISVTRTIEMMIDLPKAEQRRIMNSLKRNKLFPLKYNPEFVTGFGKHKTKLGRRIRRTLVDLSYTHIGLFLLRFFSLCLKIKSAN